MKLLYLFLFFIVATHAEKARFDNYRIYRIQLENEDQLKALRQLAETSDSYNFWSYPKKVGTSIEVMVPPHQFSHFSDITKSLSLHHEIIIKNLQEVFDNEQPRKQTKFASFMEWTEYQSIETIHEWLDSLQVEFPNWVTVSTIGHSFQGRALKLLKLSKNTGNRGVFVESHVHAREWVASATTTYIIDQFLRSSNPEVLDISANVDWYFLVITNPDGYEYTRTENRNWRKTRSVQSPLCWGVDPNRNFAHNWMVPDEYGVTGSSTSPCSDVFSGIQPFSEPETFAVHNFLSNHTGMFDVYLDMHSYDHSILYPYGNSRSLLPNENEVKTVGDAAAARLFAKHGIRYRVGNQALILYAASGNAQDHAYGHFNIPLSFTFEMRGSGDYGNFGFALPPRFIIPNAEEVLEAYIGLVQKAREFGRLN